VCISSPCQKFIKLSTWMIGDGGVSVQMTFYAVVIIVANVDVEID